MIHSHPTWSPFRNRIHVQPFQRITIQHLKKMVRPARLERQRLGGVYIMLSMTFNSYLIWYNVLSFAYLANQMVNNSLNLRPLCPWKCLVRLPLFRLIFSGEVFGFGEGTCWLDMEISSRISSNKENLENSKDKTSMDLPSVLFRSPTSSAPSCDSPHEVFLM